MRPERATLEHPIWRNVERGTLVEALANTFGKRRAVLRAENCVTFPASNPNLRLGPCMRTSLPDEREESIER
jgi:hypothetical protein